MKFVVYAVARIAFFVVPLGIMMLFPVFHDLWWLAAIFAALIGMSLSIIFLRRPLDDVSTSIAERRDGRTTKTRVEREREEEDAIEDAANDAAQREAD